MATTEIIPQIPQEGIQKAIGELETLKVTLADYEKQAKAIVVESPEQFRVAGDLKVKVNDERKRWEWTIKPLKSIAQTIKDKILTMEQEGTNKCEQIKGILEGKMVAQLARERELALAEERRVNEESRKETERLAAEQRKADEERARIERADRERQIKAAEKAGEVKKREAEKLRKEAEERERQAKEQAARDAETLKASHQDVTVLPSTPKISGLRQRQNWHFRIVDPAKVKSAFTMPDEKSIGQYVRNLKDKQKAEEAVGGIEVWVEDAI